MMSLTLFVVLIMFKRSLLVLYDILIFFCWKLLLHLFGLLTYVNVPHLVVLSLISFLCYYFRMCYFKYNQFVSSIDCQETWTLIVCVKVKYLGKKSVTCYSTVFLLNSLFSPINILIKKVIYVWLLFIWYIGFNTYNRGNNRKLFNS